MLIQLSISNFKSILERQTLSMVAGPYGEHKDTNTFALNENGDTALLRAAVMYGPNASGKSTVIAALKFLKALVLKSHQHQAGDELTITPFKLTQASQLADSEIEVVFVEQGIRYEYGVRCNKQRITEEWLFAYPSQRAQKWFHRVWNPASGKDEYKFSAHLKGGEQRQRWANETLENALFLSKAVQNKHEQLRQPFEWFSKRLKVLSSGVNSRYTSEYCLRPEQRQRVLQMLNTADLAIDDIHVKEVPFAPEQLSDDMPDELRQMLIKNLTGEKGYSLKFVHKNPQTGEMAVLDDDEESEGTRAFFAFVGPWFDVIDHDLVLVVDELDTSLHPLLVHHLVRTLFHASTKAQLVFTTHDTTLLSQDMLRRDQVWFLEKNQQNASELYSLADFSPRQGEAIERGYLNGRYGGIPLLKDWDLYGQ